VECSDYFASNENGMHGYELGAEEDMVENSRGLLKNLTFNVKYYQETNNNTGFNFHDAPYT
jgi:hypothetical protein